jgi:superfamily I DNA and RNA helicase
VKGGRIQYDGTQRQWFSIDRYDQVHRIEPFQQAVKSKYALMNKIKNSRFWNGDHINLFHCVAFVDVVKPTEEVNPESPVEIIIDSQDLRNISDKLVEIFKFWQGRTPRFSSNNTEIIQGLEHMLARHVCMENPLASRVDDEEREIIMLTEKQFFLLDVMKKNNRVAVDGCAGSGKTVLAAEKAKRLALEGKRTLLTCYNKSLAAFLHSHLGDLPKLVISSFHHLCDIMAQEAKISLPEADEIFFSETLPFALEEAMKKREDLKFDAVIVDEGQDFKELWWMVLESVLKDPENGTFYVFYDNNQVIYRESLCIPKGLTPLTLPENLRNTKEIFKLVSRFHQQGAEIECRGPEGREVEMVKYKSREDLMKNISKTLHKLVVKEKLAEDDITVLSMKSVDKENRSHLHDSTKIGNFTLCKTPTQKGEIRLSTVYSFKGLENKVVIVTDIDDHIHSTPERLNMLCYIGFL